MPHICRREDRERACIMAWRFSMFGDDETQFPAFAVIGLKTRACMMGEPSGSFENKEFLKISINSRGFSINL